jgi:hypothetical protein
MREEEIMAYRQWENNRRDWQEYLAIWSLLHENESATSAISLSQSDYCDLEKDFVVLNGPIVIGGVRFKIDTALPNGHFEKSGA